MLFVLLLFISLIIQLGAFLTRAGNKVTLVDPWFELVEKVKDKGMTVITPDEEFTQRVHIIHHDQLHTLPEKIGKMIN